jgi:hypothetical protein
MFALSAYVLDRESIRLDAYRLLCLFYANKEIARQSDPVNHYPDPARSLELRYFPRELTRLLLSIAIAVRTLDDQMERLPRGSADRDKYMRARESTNRQHLCMMFDEMTLREVCNKVIHATVVEPHSQQGAEAHHYDELMWEAWQHDHDEANSFQAEQPEPLPWEHLSGNVRLGGRYKGKQWWHLLEVPTFVSAVSDLLREDA